MMLSLIVALALQTPATGLPNSPPPGTLVDWQRAQGAGEDKNVCQMLALVGRSRHQLDQRVGPSLRPGGSYLPECDWSDHGLRGFAAGTARDRGWIAFDKPLVRGRTASVVTTIDEGEGGPVSSKCVLRRWRGDWRLQRCRPS